MKIDEIRVTRALLPSYEEYIEEIRELWESHWITNNGAKLCSFQKQLESYLRTKHVELFVNGHLALESVLESFQFPPNSEIITTPFTFASTVHAITRKNLIPVFCDINPYNYTIDTTKIENLITDKTVAILPVHVYGNICNVTDLKIIGDRYNLKIIYDAAHAFGVKYKGKSIVTFGDASVLSFHATKVFNSIEGGAICFQNDSYIQKLMDIRNFGIRDYENISYIGGNAKMNEFQAAMGICNLRHVNDEIRKRKERVKCYKSNLDGVKGIRLCDEQPNVESNYSYMPVVFDGYKYSRNQISEMLQNHGIYSRKYFYPLINDLECYRKFTINRTNYTPVAKDVSSQILVLPLYGELPSEEINKICSIILR